MSILASSTSISRYSVETSQPLFGSSIDVPKVAAVLSARGFQSIMEEPREISVGWVHINDQEATAFDNPGYLWINNFLVFSLRRDVRIIPQLILNSEIKKVSDAWLAEHPNLRRVPKQKREEFKDCVKTQLLARQLPDSQVWDVAWDMEAGVVYLFNTAGKAMETFEKLFKVTFPEFSLVYRTPWHIAEEVAEPLSLSYDLKSLDLSNSRAVLDLVKSNDWLGRDFLLWLLSNRGQAACAGLARCISWRSGLIGARLKTLNRRHGLSPQLMQSQCGDQSTHGLTMKFTGRHGRPEGSGRKEQTRGVCCYERNRRVLGVAK